MNFVWSLSIFGYMIIVFVPLFHPIVIVHVVFPAVLTFILLTMLVFCHLRFPFGTNASCVVEQLDWLTMLSLSLFYLFFNDTVSHEVNTILLSKTCYFVFIQNCVTGRNEHVHESILFQIINEHVHESILFQIILGF